MKEHWTVAMERARAALRRHGAEVTDDQGYIVAKWWGDGRSPAVEIIIDQQLELEESDVDRPTTLQLPGFARVMVKVDAALTEIETIRKGGEECLACTVKHTGGMNCPGCEVDHQHTRRGRCVFAPKEA